MLTELEVTESTKLERVLVCLFGAIAYQQRRRVHSVQLLQATRRSAFRIRAALDRLDVAVTALSESNSDGDGAYKCEYRTACAF